MHASFGAPGKVGATEFRRAMKEKPTGATQNRSMAKESAAQAMSPDASHVAGIVSRNLKQLRIRRGLTLEALAKLSGVSRGMLSQIELGRSIPTISLLWKVAHALGVRFAALTSDTGPNETTVMRGSEARILSSPDGAFTSRALFPFHAAGRVEFYKITLDGNAEEASDPHPAGTIENLALAVGHIEIIVDGSSYILDTDDAISFEADVPHCYRNIGSARAIMYVVLSYADAADSQG